MHNIEYTLTVYVFIVFGPMCNVHDMGFFKVVLYIKSCFVKYLNLRYKDGDIYAYRGLDLDYWPYFEACELIKVIDSQFDVGVVKMWWKRDDDIFEEDFKPFGDDRDASD